MNETSEMPDGASTPDIEQPMDLRALVENKNIAEGMDEKKLEEIVNDASDGFEYDFESRKHWEKNLDEWTKLALQTREDKSWPWVGASNVKYPLVSIASMQFNARAYPSLVPASSSVVKCEVIGKDPTGEKLEKAKRIGTYMSYQVLNQMTGWEEDMDKLLIMLPIIGTMFKKTYYDPVTKQNVSELVLPKNLVVNYWAKTLEKAERVSEIIPMTKREVKQRQMSGTFLDVDLGEPQVWDLEANVAVKQDDTTPYSIIEQHTYIDLDEDGYSEPYIVTFERHSKKLLRITARFDETTIFQSETGKLQKIDPIYYYTKFSFIPNPDGGFYDIGFGLLLSPINESVNTLINQLIDAGTLSNLQGGFLGKGLKLKMGESKWNPGEWKAVNSTADDLRKQIVPLPVKEPSAVLFQLMGTLITSGKELASVAEIFVGKMPGQNTPATTTMATIEQGMKVFTAVYKRVYRSLKSEFKKIFDLNKTYLDPDNYANVVDVQIMPDDFDGSSYDICPGADPNTATQTEKLMKAQGLLELLPTGILDPVKVVGRVLEAQEQPNYEELFSQAVQQTGQVPQQPDPKMMEMEMKAQIEQQKAGMKQQELAFKSELAARDQQFKQMMEAQAMEQEAKYKERMAMLDEAAEIHKQRIFSATEQAKMNQQLVQKDQSHRQSMAQAKEKAELVNKQAKNTSKTGKTTP